MRGGLLVATHPREPAARIRPGRSATSDAICFDPSPSEEAAGERSQRVPSVESQMAMSVPAPATSDVPAAMKVVPVDATLDIR